jgi:hypothetical protein
MSILQWLPEGESGTSNAYIKQFVKITLPSFQPPLGSLSRCLTPLSVANSCELV